jgi:hypothetical protein
VDDWVRAEVANGLQALLSLRLRNAPAEDMIELTADIWAQAFAARASVESLDAPRIREGFRRIFPRVREWPAPAEVLEKMPDRPPQPALPAPRMSDEEHAAISQRFQVMIDDLSAKMNVRAPKRKPK